MYKWRTYVFVLRIIYQNLTVACLELVSDPYRDKFGFRYSVYLLH
jgi:hypothetical protein